MAGAWGCACEGASGAAGPTAPSGAALAGSVAGRSSTAEKPNWDPEHPQLGQPNFDPAPTSNRSF